MITVVHAETPSADMAKVCLAMTKELKDSQSAYAGLQELRRFPPWMMPNEPYEKRSDGEVVSPGGIHGLPVKPGSNCKPVFEMTSILKPSISRPP